MLLAVLLRPLWLLLCLPCVIHRHARCPWMRHPPLCYSLLMQRNVL
jgi:hypothetical protein